MGCAGWSIPKASKSAVPSGGSHLERYAAVLRAVEIDSSFTRSHRPETYARWAASVPEDFRFSVKVPRQVTHTSRLGDLEALKAFLGEVAGLGGRLGPLLVQLPPGLAYDPKSAGGFFEALRKESGGEVVCEPRHPAWFSRKADRLLASFRVARAAADPSPAPGGDLPGGWRGLSYFRLHGSPRRYWSAYESGYLDRLAQDLLLEASRAPVWCIFDNTALGAALPNALYLRDRLSARTGRQRRGGTGA